MTITEVGKKFNMTADTLRYYEKIGLVDRVQRNASGIRNYQENDINRIEFIRCMRNAGLSIDVLKRYIDLLNEGEETVEERKMLLKEQRVLLAERMEEMKKTLERLDFKIANYENVIVKKEKELHQIDAELIGES